MKKRYTITLSPELVKRAKIRAVKDDIKFSTLIEKLLRRYVDNKERRTDND